MNGKFYWRSLEQLAQTVEFKEYLHREFPEGASELPDPITRRNFLTLMGASMALAGLAGCRKPLEEIVPYVKAPEEVVLGKPLKFATSMPTGSSAVGLLVTSFEGRPTHIEGNALHPSSLGGTNSFMQAEILNLYDPDRSQNVLRHGALSSWDDFVEFWRGLRAELIASKGEGLAVLSPPYASPSLHRLRGEFLAAYPRAYWVCWDAVSDENIFEGTRIAMGEHLRPAYHFDRAKVILSLDADFLFGESENAANARGFIEGRRVTDERSMMNRLYAVESNYSLTGGMADHRLRLQSRQVGAFTAALASKLAQLGADVGGIADVAFTLNARLDRKWIDAVANDLWMNRGKALIVAGRGQPAEVHALVAGLNSALGNIGNAVDYYQFQDAGLPTSGDLTDLTRLMNAGKINTLAMLGTNPVYHAPADLNFAAAMEKVTHTVHLGSHVDETAAKSEWHVPEAHFLESWGDARAADGTPSVVQPLIEPLWGGKSAWEFAALLASGLDRRGYELVRESWAKILGSLEFERDWRRTLHDGIYSGENINPAKVEVRFADISAALKANPFPAPSRADAGSEVVFKPDSSVFDGRYSNNGWMHEAPDPVTKLMWDNAALVSTKTARELGLRDEDVARLMFMGRELEIPVLIQPGHADESITLTLGYGRQMGGRIADGVGFNVGVLRTTDALNFGSGLTTEKTGRTHMLPRSQDHHSMEGRALVREASLEEYRRHPEFAIEAVDVPPLQSLWKEHQYDEGYQWGMTIDLNACIGCGACTVACQSENNIPIVGRQQASRGREMHWIRLDRYWEGSIEDPKMATQPVACQHCEMAPCEQVCPVAATNHDREGLNVMVYNRCVGTRYCSNNCPYKVRRFNFFNYTNKLPEVVQMAQNPDVTVRSRGVMEKCTYCLQRINRARNDAKAEGREIRDGDIVTACQSACPTQAIVFGNIRDAESRVAQLKQSNRSYNLLAELNTRPRTSFLARIRNPNPELE